MPASRTATGAVAVSMKRINKRFGAIVESLGTTPAQIVVERAMYWNGGGEFWGGGTNETAVRIR
mgnify:CR=1 FL=1